MTSLNLNIPIVFRNNKKERKVKNYFLPPNFFCDLFINYNENSVKYSLNYVIFDRGILNLKRKINKCLEKKARVDFYFNLNIKKKSWFNSGCLFFIFSNQKTLSVKLMNIQH